MNKKVYVSFVLLLLILWPINMGTNELPEITVRVNPNFELLAIVYTLAAENPVIVDQEYFDDLMEYFGDYKEHEVAERMKHPSENFLMEQQRLLLNTSDPPEMKSNTEGEFIDLLRDFAVETDFMKFYDDHQNYYQKYYDFLYENTAIKEIPSLFNNFFGVSMSKMHIESSFSYLPCLPHAEWEGKNESLIAYFFNNSCYTPKNSLETKAIALDWDRLILHEFGHATADMLENRGEMHQTFSYILDPAKLDMKQRVGNITTDHSYIEPFIAWAFDRIYGEPWGEWLISQDCSMGLHICPYIYELIKNDYIPNRETYPTFDSYVPRLLEKLGEIVTPHTTKDYYNKTMYTSVYRGFFGNNRENKILIIYGTQNPDPTGTEHDRKVAEEWAQLFSSIGLMTTVMKDTEVTETDLSGNNFILIGGPVANKITKELNENLPIKFEEENGKWGIVHNLPQDTLVFSGFYDKLIKSMEKERYEDSNIGVIEAFSNPYNEEKYGVLIAGNAREGTNNAGILTLFGIYPFAVSYQINAYERVHEQGFYRD